MSTGQDQRGIAVHMWEPTVCSLLYTVLVKEGITCSSPMEETYYAGKNHKHMFRQECLKLLTKTSN